QAFPACSWWYPCYSSAKARHLVEQWACSRVPPVMLELSGKPKVPHPVCSQQAPARLSSSLLRPSLLGESVGATWSHLAFGVCEQCDDVGVCLLHKSLQLMDEILHLAGRQTVGKVNFKDGDDLFG